MDASCYRLSSVGVMKLGSLGPTKMHVGIASDKWLERVPVATPSYNQSLDLLSELFPNVSGVQLLDLWMQKRVRKFVIASQGFKSQ
jgi:hypothetical protein